MVDDRLAGRLVAMNGFELLRCWYGNLEIIRNILTYNWKCFSEAKREYLRLTVRVVGVEYQTTKWAGKYHATAKQGAP